MRLVALLMAGLVLLAGCKTYSERKSEIELDKTLKTYEALVRWGELEKTYALLKPAEGETVTIPDGLDNIQVTSYEVIEGPTPVGENKVGQTVRIRFVQRDRQVVRSVLDQQIWESEEIDGREVWLRTSPIPSYQ